MCGWVWAAKTLAYRVGKIMFQYNCSVVMLIKKKTGLQKRTWVGKLLLRTPLISETKEGDVCMSEKPLCPLHKRPR